MQVAHATSPVLITDRESNLQIGKQPDWLVEWRHVFVWDGADVAESNAPGDQFRFINNCRAAG